MKLFRIFTIFSACWLPIGGIIFIMLMAWPEIQKTESKELEIRVESGRKYELLALERTKNSLQKLPSPNDVQFDWKPSNGHAITDVSIGSSSSTATFVDQASTNVAFGILNFTPRRSGSLLIRSEAPGEYGLGIFSGFRFTVRTLILLLALSGILFAILFGILRRISFLRKQPPAQTTFA